MVGGELHNHAATCIHRQVSQFSTPLWAGRFSEAEQARPATALSGTLEVDLPLAEYDVTASGAHVDELHAAGLLDDAGRERLHAALESVSGALRDGSFPWRVEHEDIHMNVEAAVIERAGPELGGMLQAGRSRNEEIVTDERLWLKANLARLGVALENLQRTLVTRAADEQETILPAHTHTQPAQPVLLAHHLLAYVEMLCRDRDRLADALGRIDSSPAGSGAAVGSGLPLDRERVAARLGFGGVTANSLDAVASRDYVAETVAAVAICIGHLSRICGELVLWSTPYVGFARLPDGYSSGSSMLPNKRNPDAAELVRARAARIVGDLVTVLELPRGLPLAYHRDLQETRRAMFDAVESLALSVEATREMLAGVAFDRDRMRQAATAGHALATALAERLLRAGVPFRDAHRRVGALVARAEASGVDLAALPPDELRAALPELDGGDAIMPTLEEAVGAADVAGGTAPRRVADALAAAAMRLGVELPT